MSILKQIFAANASITAAAKKPTFRVQRQSLDDARNKAIAKIAASKAWLETGAGEQPDLVYALDQSNNYSVGIKCGNRWLANAIEGQTFVLNVPADTLPQVLDGLIELLESGACDAHIQAALAANATRTRKSK